MRLTLNILLLGLVSLWLSGCQQLLHIIDEAEEVKPLKLTAKDFAAGLSTPMGMTVDLKGQIWVTEAGSGKNDGKVSVITPDGTVYPVITGFSSSINPEGIPGGLNHLLYKDGMLYILHGTDGKLYFANVASFKPGDAPLQADQLKAEDIGQFVRDYAFEEDAEESNLYDLTFGHDGNLYLVDAAANAVIRRTSTGAVSVFATIANIKNPTPIGPPTINAVPTGIVSTKNGFLVSTLLGFPFPEGKAGIYQVDRSGKVSLYQEGFTTLVDIILGPDQRPIVVEFAKFGQQGFTPSTGRIARATGQKSTVLIEGLNFPTSIAKGGLNTYYVNSLAEGKVQRLSY